MARMLPPSIVDDHGSAAERRIFQSLRDQTPRDWTVIHSVGLTNHSHKQWAEVDFVAVTHRGVFCLEVKGGRIRHDAGRWFTNDRQLTESPFAQVGGGSSALRHYLGEAGIEAGRRSLFGYGVLFPDVIFDQHLPESDSDLVYDAADTAAPIEKYILRLADYWAEKFVARRGSPPAGLSRGDRSRIVHEIAPDFDLVPSLRAVLSEVEDELVRLTDQQVELLEGLIDSPRVVVRGGAGTGKTLVACHEATRLARAGFRTMYICFGSRLADAIRPVLSDHGVEVFHAHGLMSALTREAELAHRLPDVDTDDLMDIYYPQLALDALGVLDRLGAVDALVIDEGQDLLKEPTLVFFDGLLGNELSGGMWRLFYDPNQDLFGGGQSAGLDELEARAVSYRLRRNCRNTRQIAIATAIVSGAPMSETMTTEGPDVVERWYSDVEKQHRETKRLLQEWLERGIQAEDVVILAPRTWENSGLASARLPRRVVDVSAGADPQVGQFQFSTVHGFKGLEADVVLLTGFDDLGARESASLLYVGASRAKALLGLLLNDHTKAQYIERAADVVARMAHTF